jgi:hypothetical protein
VCPERTQNENGQYQNKPDITQNTYERWLHEFSLNH